MSFMFNIFGMKACLFLKKQSIFQDLSLELEGKEYVPYLLGPFFQGVHGVMFGCVETSERQVTCSRSLGGLVWLFSSCLNKPGYAHTVHQNEEWIAVAPALLAQINQEAAVNYHFVMSTLKNMANALQQFRIQKPTIKQLQHSLDSLEALNMVPVGCNKMWWLTVASRLVCSGRCRGAEWRVLRPDMKCSFFAF